MVRNTICFDYLTINRSVNMVCLKYSNNITMAWPFLYKPYWKMSNKQRFVSGFLGNGPWGWAQFELCFCKAVSKISSIRRRCIITLFRFLKIFFMRFSYFWCSASKDLEMSIKLNYYSELRIICEHFANWST